MITSANDLEDMTRREFFIRQKYQIFAFALPSIIMNDNSDINEPKNYGSHNNSSSQKYQRMLLSKSGTSSWASILENDSSTRPNQVLPNRFMDFFCVFGASDQVIEVRQNNDTVSCEDIYLQPMMIDSYPNRSYSDGTSLPSGPLPMFVFPDGCQPCSYAKDPQLFSFVLTDERGTRVFGTALTIYDEVLGRSHLTDVLHKSGYKGTLKAFDSGSNGTPSEFVFLPKVLVVLSHYSFYNAMKVFLQQLFRISINGAPLPLERYIQHFISEIGLPPFGKVEISFAHTDVSCSISRPPRNRLPLADFSYRPLFSTLSVTNVIVIISCLMLEHKICLCSDYYSLLSSIAEALQSLLFPFTWAGVYIPIIPATMLDILDAPVPFLVGMHRRFLDNQQVNHIKDVIFVDIDNDIVHLRFEYKNGELNKRCIPLYPQKMIGKLRLSLMEASGDVYLSSTTFEPGRITTGDNEAIQLQIE